MASVVFDDNVILVSLEVGQWENFWSLSTYKLCLCHALPRPRCLSTHGVSDKRRNFFVRNHFRIIIVGNSYVNCHPKRSTKLCSSQSTSHPGVLGSIRVKTYPTLLCCWGGEGYNIKRCLGSRSLFL